MKNNRDQNPIKRFFITTLPLIFGTMASQNVLATVLSDADFIEFKTSVVFLKSDKNDGVRTKRFCNGHPSQTLHGICCELEIKTPGVEEKRISQAAHRIAWIAPIKNQTYINIEVLSGEISNSEFHQIDIRCSNRPPTWETLNAAFGSLIQKSDGDPLTEKSIPFDPLYRPNFTNNQPAKLLGETFAVLTHANLLWDSPRTTESAIKKILQFSKTNAVASIGLTSNQTRLPYFFKKQDVTYIAQSETGQLKLIFPSGHNFIFGGGNLELCLCETIRDVIRGSLDEARPLNVFIITDAVFDRLGEKFAWPGAIESAYSLDGKITRQRYTVPLRAWEGDKEVGPKEWTSTIAGSFRLKDLYDLKPRQLFWNQIENYVLRTKAAPDGLPVSDMCIQNSYNFPKLDRRLIELQLFDGIIPFSTFKSGSRPPFTVRVMFVDSSNLENVFKYWKAK